jgi:hypothetical protein
MFKLWQIIMIPAKWFIRDKKEITENGFNPVSKTDDGEHIFLGREDGAEA